MARGGSRARSTRRSTSCVRRGVPRDDANWRSLPEGAQISFAAPDWTRQDEALNQDTVCSSVS
eukprot:31442-Pelagococcus_subviridis.AAC.6